MCMPGNRNMEVKGSFTLKTQALSEFNHLAVLAGVLWVRMEPKAGLGHMDPTYDTHKVPFHVVAGLHQGRCRPVKRLRRENESVKHLNYNSHETLQLCRQKPFNAEQTGNKMFFDQFNKPK